MKKLLATLGIVSTLVLGGIEAGVPASEKLDNFITNPEKAKTHRKYLRERADYLETNGVSLGVPQNVIDGARPQTDEFEDYLLRKKMIDNKGDVDIKESPKGVIEPIFGAFKRISFVQRAYAFTFGKEDFESCGAIPCSFDSNTSYGTSNISLDSGSIVNGTDSARCDIAAVTSDCSLEEAFTSADEMWYQFYIFIPSGWTFGASSYAGLLETEDGVGFPVSCNIEDYGTVRITCSGDELGYTDTGINIALNTKTKLEFRVKVSATVGDLDIWKSNDVEGSPDYNGSGTLNTGTQNMINFSIGGYHPDVVNDKYYDDVIFDTGFIGDGVVPSVANPADVEISTPMIINAPINI